MVIILYLTSEQLSHRPIAEPMKMSYAGACLFHISQPGRVQFEAHYTAMQFSYLSNGMTDLVYSRSRRINYIM